MVMRRRPALLTCISIGLLYALPTSALADCTRKDVERELTRWGYSYEFGRTTENGGHLFAIKRDGERFVLRAEANGDIRFSKYFRNSLNLTNDDAASIMESLAYLQIYIDSDGDIALDYSIANFGTRDCNKDLNNLTKQFMGLAEEAELRMMAP